MHIHTSDFVGEEVRQNFISSAKTSSAPNPRRSISAREKLNYRGEARTRAITGKYSAIVRPAGVVVNFPKNSRRVKYQRHPRRPTGSFSFSLCLVQWEIHRRGSRAALVILSGARGRERRPGREDAGSRRAGRVARAIRTGRKSRTERRNVAPGDFDPVSHYHRVHVRYCHRRE